MTSGSHPLLFTWYAELQLVTLQAPYADPFHVCVPVPFVIAHEIVVGMQLPPANVYPELHEATPQTPAVHAGLPLATGGQAFPQALQFATSVCNPTSHPFNELPSQ